MFQLKPRNRDDYHRAKKLQHEVAKWYAVLKQLGFSDLEWLDRNTGAGQNSPYLQKGSSTTPRAYSPATQFFYELCRAYLEQGPLDDIIDRRIWELYSDGCSYRNISRIIRAEAKKRTGPARKNKSRTKALEYKLFWVQKRIRELRSDMFTWHYHSDAGMLKPDDELDSNERYLAELRECMEDNRGIGDG